MNPSPSNGPGDFSRRFPVILERQARERKAQKILTVLRDCCPALAGFDGLDIGCSSGAITGFLGEHLRSLIGVDVDEAALEQARSEPQPTGVRFMPADAMNLPFAAGSFHLVLCNHVYEHVPDAERLLDEIHRVLRPGGWCYFSASNRFRIMEGHHHLPFLSWLPGPLADRYLRLLGRGARYEERHRGYLGLRRLVRRFRLRDYTARVIEEPERFASEDLLPPGSLRRRLAQRWHRPLVAWLPTYIWMLEKAAPAGGGGGH